MTELLPDAEPAWEDLGGREPEHISIESKRAMIRAGLGSRAMADEVRVYEEKEEYSHRYLSGVADRTPEQDEALHQFQTDANDALDAQQLEHGADPVTVAVRRRLREERRTRRA